MATTTTTTATPATATPTANEISNAAVPASETSPSQRPETAQPRAATPLLVARADRN